MTTTQSLLAFVLAASILTITPGLDTAFVLRCAAAGGPRTAAYAAVGIVSGLLVWGAAVSIGLGALLSASALAFNILKWIGAAYLFCLGLKLLIRPRHSFDTAPGALVPIDPHQSLRQGLLTNVLNPKVGVFYVTLLPQFVPIGVSVVAFTFLLATIHLILRLAWFALLIAATVPLGRFIRLPRIVSTMDRVTGGVFVLFGIRLALSK